MFVRWQNCIDQADKHSNAGRLTRPSSRRSSDYAEKTVWLLSRLLFVYPRDLYNAATSRTLVNPAVISFFL